MDSEIQYAPMDVRALRKGQLISIAEIESTMRCRRDAPNYGLKILALREWITKELKKIGIIYTMKVDHGALRILDDAAASEYNRQQGHIKIRGFRRAHRRALAVDITNLSYRQLTAHGRTILVQAAYLSAIDTTRSRLAAPSPRVRNTPVIGVEEPAAGNGESSE